MDIEKNLQTEASDQMEISEMNIHLVPSTATLVPSKIGLSLPSAGTTKVHLRWSNVNKNIDQEVPDNGGLEKNSKKFNFSTFLGGRKKKTVKKQILFDLSGQANPGEIIAIMGPSGSGKTTLLSTLGGRIAHEGEVAYNGQKINKSMKRHTAFVLQEDNFFDLTVRQQLLFTAQLRLPEKLTYKEKFNRVEEVLLSLGLTECADSRISLISGGEKKRTNIATELLTDPSLILLDEPTSGLDSTSAVRLVKLLKDLASNGKTIITSIHQPSSQVFESFDKIILMADGKMVYYGVPKLASDYFSSLGYPCPAQYNPADHIMDIVQDQEVRKKVTNAFVLSDEVLVFLNKKNNEKSIECEDEYESQDLEKLPKFATGFWTQLRVLFYRTALNKKGSLFTWL
ncbi:hypothetical protein HK096_005089, partial [Nowakowskiella sp. JEL0078]